MAGRHCVRGERFAAAKRCIAWDASPLAHSLALCHGTHVPENCPLIVCIFDGGTACPQLHKKITALSLSALQIAQFSAELERYPRAVELYEEVAKASVENNLLKYRCSVLLKSWTFIRSTES